MLLSGPIFGGKSNKETQKRIVLILFLKVFRSAGESHSLNCYSNCLSISQSLKEAYFCYTFLYNISFIYIYIYHLPLFPPPENCFFTLGWLSGSLSIHEDVLDFFAQFPPWWRTRTSVCVCLHLVYRKGWFQWKINSM